MQWTPNLSEIIKGYSSPCVHSAKMCLSEIIFVMGEVNATLSIKFCPVLKNLKT